jgi:hypothetical protein
MKIIFPALICAAALIVFLFLSHPLELRSTRWRKILLSAPLVFLVAIGMSSSLDFKLGLASVAGVVVLSFIWCGNLSWFFGGSFAGFFYGDISSPTGMGVNFRYAKNHRRDGELKQAIVAIEHELKKDPKNFEGLLLLAGVYQDLKQPEKALVQLAIVSNNPDATESQKEVARAEVKQCEQLQKHLAAAQGNSRK